MITKLNIMKLLIIVVIDQKQKAKKDKTIRYIIIIVNVIKRKDLSYKIYLLYLSLALEINSFNLKLSLIH